MSVLLTGCGGGGGTNLPAPGSGNGGLGDNGGNGGPNIPALSANTLAFVSTRDGNPEIYTINADGSNATRITTNNAVDEQPSRSPDGRRIVFSSRRDGNSEIYIINSDKSGLQRLTADTGPAAAAPVDNQPVFSPDGSKIVWQSTRGGVRRLWVMDASVGNTGNNQRALTFSDSAQPSFDGSWNPDSQRVLGLLPNANNTNLNDLSLITPGATATAPATFQLLRSGTTAFHPRYAPNGSRIVFNTSSTQGQASLGFADANGAPIAGAPTGGLNQLSPSFSPDGNRLVWDANTSAGTPNRQLYVATIGTTSATGSPITTSAQGENYDASWTQ